MTNSELRSIYNYVAENSKLNDYQNLEKKKHIRKDINALLLLDSILKRNQISTLNIILFADLINMLFTLIALYQIFLPISLKKK